LDLIDFFPQIEPTCRIKDIEYNKIISSLTEFIENLSDNDKQLILQIINKCYFKYEKSIKGDKNSGFELNTRMLMSILIDQQIQIDNLIKKSK
jgi:hypothetical protein